MSNRESVENYLKALLILRRKKGGCIRQVDLAQQMGFSKPSVSKAVHLMEQRKLVCLSGNAIYLTPEGEARAREVLDKHEYFTRLLVRCGVDPMTASEEACGMEHVISDESFRLIQRFIALLEIP